MIKLKLKEEFLESVVCVILRVPALFIAEVWFRSDPVKASKVDSEDMEMIVYLVSYLGKILSGNFMGVTCTFVP